MWESAEKALSSLTVLGRKILSGEFYQKSYSKTVVRIAYKVDKNLYFESYGSCKRCCYRLGSPSSRWPGWRYLRSGCRGLWQGRSRLNAIQAKGSRRGLATWNYWSRLEALTNCPTLHPGEELACSESWISSCCLTIWPLCCNCCSANVSHHWRKRQRHHTWATFSVRYWKKSRQGQAGDCFEQGRVFLAKETKILENVEKTWKSMPTKELRP